MRKTLVISRKLSHNLEGWYGYHISKNSKLYLSRYLNTSRMRYRLSRKLVNDLILDKEEKGFTNRELSKKYKISKACVSHYLNRYKPKI